MDRKHLSRGAKRKRSIVEEDDSSDFEDTVITKKPKQVKKRRKTIKKAATTVSPNISTTSKEATTSQTNKKKLVKAKSESAKDNKSKDKLKKATSVIITPPKQLSPEEFANKVKLLFGDLPMNSGAKYLGAHVSKGKGLDKALELAVNTGFKAIAFFTRNQRTWKQVDLTDKEIKAFKAKVTELKYDVKLILPHGSYLCNMGSPNSETRDKSRDCFLNEMTRCAQLGIKKLNIHPGSAKKEITVAEAIDYIAESINWVLAKPETKDVSVILENSAGTIGRTFEELKSLIDKIEDKKRVGVCLDTCHLFAGGYDIRTADGYKNVMDKFDEIVGFKWLQGIHLNDSKSKLGSKVDRHEEIGKGHIGLDCFKFIMADPRLNNIPIILETPGDNQKAEVELLYSLQSNKNDSDDDNIDSNSNSNSNNNSNSNSKKEEE